MGFSYGVLAAVMVLSGAALIACQNRYDDLADYLTRGQGIEINEISIDNSEELNALKTYLSNSQAITKTKRGAAHGISFDSTKIKTYHIVNSDLNFYFVPQTDFTEDKNVNFSAAYVHGWGRSEKWCYFERRVVDG